MRLGIIGDLFQAVKWHISGPKYVKVEKYAPMILRPKKPRVHIPVDMSNSIAWKGIVQHHTGDNDDPLAEDFDRVQFYQTSYRFNYRIIAAPQFGKLNPNIKYVTYGKTPFQRYYIKADVDKWYKLKKKAAEEDKVEYPWRTGAYQVISEYVNGEILVRIMRPFYMTGGHSGVGKVPGKDGSYFNKWYIGCNQIGNFNKSKMTKLIWNHNLAVARELMDKFGFGTDKVIGHREVYPKFGLKVKKPCPGMNWDMDKFRREL